MFTLCSNTRNIGPNHELSMSFEWTLKVHVLGTVLHISILPSAFIAIWKLRTFLISPKTKNILFEVGLFTVEHTIRYHFCPVGYPFQVFRY